jgi:anti-anti-sigma factor
MRRGSTGSWLVAAFAAIICLHKNGFMMTEELRILPLDEPRSYSVAGELDASTANQLAEVLRGEGQASGDVVLDISGVTFMDSSGVHILLVGCEWLRDGHLILRDPSPPIDQVFELVDIERVKGIRVERTP